MDASLIERTDGICLVGRRSGSEKGRERKEDGGAATAAVDEESYFSADFTLYPRLGVQNSLQTGGKTSNG